MAISLLILDPIWGHPERKETNFDILVGFLAVMNHPRTLLHVRYKLQSVSEVKDHVKKNPNSLTDVSTVPTS